MNVLRLDLSIIMMVVMFVFMMFLVMFFVLLVMMLVVSVVEIIRILMIDAGMCAYGAARRRYDTQYKREKCCRQPCQAVRSPQAKG
ncbi:MAG: hypothetical protein K2K22_02450 [Muribaculaceae bacterium]|nr:hypothetical protein [Muribaculaceae bacterium]